MSQVNEPNTSSRTPLSLPPFSVFMSSLPRSPSLPVCLFTSLLIFLPFSYFFVFYSFPTVISILSFEKGMVGETKLLAYHLEDITKAKNRTDGVKQIEWSIAGKLSSTRDYQWYIVYRPLLLKMASLICMLMSLFSLLGVICSMDGVTPAVSVYFHAVHNDEASATGIAIFVLFSLGYTTYVTLWSLFQIR